MTLIHRIRSGLLLLAVVSAAACHSPRPREDSTFERMLEATCLELTEPMGHSGGGPASAGGGSSAGAELEKLVSRLRTDPGFEIARQDPAKGEAASAKASGSEEGKEGLDEINNKLNNPGAEIASLNFKFSWDTFKGDLPRSRSRNSFGVNFQPVLPFVLDEETNLLVRPSFPFVRQPVFKPGRGEWDSEAGLGDAQLVALYAKTLKEEGVFYGVGPTMQFPTHTDKDLGKDQFQLGPAAYAGKFGKWGAAGGFLQHFWNIGGSDGYTSLSVIQVFYWFAVGDGWQVGGSPIATCDWAYDNYDDAWTVPINLGVAKTFAVGKTPVKVKLEGVYYVESPDTFGPNWGIQLTVTPVISNPLAGLFD